MGCAAFFIYLGIASGIDQLSIMFLPFIYTAITFIAISAVVVLLISLFVQPKAKHLSFRKIPLKQFRLLGRAALIFSIALALMVVPTTITMASAYRALSNDYASWESLKDAVGISYNDVNGLYNDYWMPMVENFFAEMADRDNLCLSMAVDRAIVLDNAKMGKYDHIVVTDRAWVETTVFGDNSDKADSLIPIGFDDIHAELKDFCLSSSLFGRIQEKYSRKAWVSANLTATAFGFASKRIVWQQHHTSEKSIDYSGGGARENVESKQLSSPYVFEWKHCFQK